MTQQDIHKIEVTHMGRAGISFIYRGRFLVCVTCESRFRMRHNGTLHWIEPKE